ncbi:MAG: hypothetical protein ACHQFW_11090 [Chitinophagales bacterium]
MEHITLHTDQNQMRTRKISFRFNFVLWILKLMGWKFIEAPDTSEYKYNPEQYCIDRGILQHPSSFHSNGRRRVRQKD